MAIFDIRGRLGIRARIRVSWLGICDVTVLLVEIEATHLQFRRAWRSRQFQLLDAASLRAFIQKRARCGAAFSKTSTFSGDADEFVFNGGGCRAAGGRVSCCPSQ